MNKKSKCVHSSNEAACVLCRFFLARMKGVKIVGCNLVLIKILLTQGELFEKGVR
jgi:hypothetical protein